MRILLFLLTLLVTVPLKAQEAPASANILTLGPIDGESDQKTSVVTLRYDSKPAFQKPVVEAHGSFLQVVLPNTLVLKPGVFKDANSPYIRKIAPFQLDEDTAAVRLFVTKEAENLAPAVSVDILENRVLITLDHDKAEKILTQNFSGVPVTSSRSPDQIVSATPVRSDIPDPISLMSASKVEAPQAVGPEEAAPTAAVENDPAKLEKASVTESTNLPAKSSGAEAAQLAKSTLKEAPPVETPRWADSIETKLVAVTIFCALMLGFLIALKSWRKVAAKTLPPGADFSLKTIATHVIGPKQKITVIQVGQEQILLGVSSDSINFLTSLRPQAEAYSAARITPELMAFPKTLSPSPKRSALSEEAESLRRPSLTRSEPLQKRDREREAKSSGVEPGSSIRYGVGDEGIKNFKGGKNAVKSESNEESLEDVTRLIRKKLKDLPKV